jgi:hypothetical protein
MSMAAGPGRNLTLSLLVQINAREQDQIASLI